MNADGADRLDAEVAAAASRVRARIRSALERSGRSAAGVQIIAVTKGQPPELVRAAAAAGLCDIGENRVQEALAKKGALGAFAAGLRWHLIGHLQRNKVRHAWDEFVLIHSVDSGEVADRLARRAIEAGREVPVLVQVNVAGEPTKHGFTGEQVLAEFGRLRRLPGIAVRGLMTMAPWAADPEEVRPVFRALRLLRDRLAAEHGVDLPELSMGMSGDFEVAVEEGASMVRLGTVLFGARPVEAA